MPTQKINDLFINHINNLTTALMMTDEMFANLSFEEFMKISRWASYAQADVFTYHDKVGDTFATKLIGLTYRVDEKLELREIK